MSDELTHDELFDPIELPRFLDDDAMERIRQANEDGTCAVEDIRALLRYAVAIGYRCSEYSKAFADCRRERNQLASFLGDEGYTGISIQDGKQAR
jgi:hypothetical protein